MPVLRRSKLIGNRKIRTIFGNISEVLETHKQMLKIFEEWCFEYRECNIYGFTRDLIAFVSAVTTTSNNSSLVFGHSHRIAFFMWFLLGQHDLFFHNFSPGFVT